MKPVEISTDDLSEVLGVKRSQIYSLAGDGVIVKVGPNTFDLAASCKGYIAHLRSFQGSPELQNQKERLHRIQGDRAELRLKRERGEQVSTEAAMKSWGNVCSVFRARLLSIPTKLAPLVAGHSAAQAKETIEEHMHKVLLELSNPKLTVKKL